MVNRSQKHKIKRSLPKEYYRILFCAIITNLFIANEDTHRLVDSRFSGALAITYCLTNKEYYLKLIDIKGHSGVLWQSLYTKDSKYTRDNSYLQTFKVSKQQHYQSAGFVFYNEDDARRFYKRVIYRTKYVQKLFEADQAGAAAPAPAVAQKPAEHPRRSHNTVNPENAIASPGPLQRCKSPQIVSPPLSVDENHVDYVDDNPSEDLTINFDTSNQNDYLNRYVQLDSQIDNIIPKRHDHKSKKPSESQLFRANKNNYKKPMMFKEPSYTQTKSRSSYYDYNKVAARIIQNPINTKTVSSPNPSIKEQAMQSKNTLVARYKDLAEMPECVRKSVVLLDDSDDDDSDFIIGNPNSDEDEPEYNAYDEEELCEARTHINTITNNDAHRDYYKPVTPQFSDFQSPTRSHHSVDDNNSGRYTIRSGVRPPVSRSSSVSTTTAINNVNSMLSMVGTQTISQRDSQTRFIMHKSMNHDKELFPELFKSKDSPTGSLSSPNVGVVNQVSFNGGSSILSNIGNFANPPRAVQGISSSSVKNRNSLVNDETGSDGSPRIRSNNLASSIFNKNTINRTNSLISSSFSTLGRKRNSIFDKNSLRIIEDDEISSFNNLSDSKLGKSHVMAHDTTPNFSSTSAISINDDKSRFGKLSLSRKISVRMPKLDQFVSVPTRRLSFLQKKATQNDEILTTINPDLSSNNDKDKTLINNSDFLAGDTIYNKDYQETSFARSVSRRFSNYSNSANRKYDSNNKKNLQISAPIPIEVLEMDEPMPESPLDDIIGYKHTHDSSVSSSSGISEFTNNNLFLSVR